VTIENQAPLASALCASHWITDCIFCITKSGGIQLGEVEVLSAEDGREDEKEETEFVAVVVHFEKIVASE
jgi:hypothetical protein